MWLMARLLAQGPRSSTLGKRSKDTASHKATHSRQTTRHARHNTARHGTTRHDLIATVSAHGCNLKRCLTFSLQSHTHSMESKVKTLDCESLKQQLCLLARLRYKDKILRYNRKFFIELPSTLTLCSKL